jgi:hypothetical protein
MTKGEQILIKVYELIKRPDTPMKDYMVIMKLVEPFLIHPDDLDLMTICRLEVILNEELLIIPTKQQWRKIKLEKINDISKNE